MTVRPSSGSFDQPSLRPGSLSRTEGVNSDPRRGQDKKVKIGPNHAHPCCLAKVRRIIGGMASDLTADVNVFRPPTAPSGRTALGSINNDFGIRCDSRLWPSDDPKGTPQTPRNRFSISDPLWVNRFIPR
jgi:hypothetical protein